MVSVVLGVGWALLVVAQATLLADGITAVFQGGAGLRQVTPLLGWLAAVVLGRAGLAWAQEAAAHRASATAVSQLRDRLLTQVARLGPAWLTGARSGELVALATRGVDALHGYFSRYLPQVVLAAIVPLVVLARIFPADLIAGVTIVVTLPLIPLFMALVGRGTADANRRQFRQLARLSHHFLDVVTGLSTLRSFNRARPQAETIRAVTDQYRRLTLRTLRLAFLSGLVLELLATLSVALVAVGVGLRLVGGELDLRTALLVLILAPEAYLPLRTLSTHYHASAEGLAAAKEIFTVLETEPVQAGGGVAPPVGAAITFDGVSVRYPGRDRAAVEDLALRVEPGEIVGLAGPSGAGKSTILALLLGFVRPSTGTIRVGEQPLSNVDVELWRTRIAWLPQSPHLVAGTVAANIRLGRPDADDADVRAAAVRAAAAEVVAGLPDGYDTVIGDGGRGLSAGQRQRIAVARALIRPADLVLLDEPTANLDEANEAEVIAALRLALPGRTVILVAHRPAILALADRVIHLEAPDFSPADGRVRTVA